MLKFLADVNIEKPIVGYLNDNGYDVLWIPDFDCRMNDNELLDLANRENRILITNDKDFGEIIFLQKRISEGVILFRVKGQDVDKKIRGLDRILQMYKNNIPDHFIVISDKKIRFTDLGEN